jgi:hypothetical protein
LGKSSPNIVQPSTRHKNRSPRSLEAQSGECATSAERRVTLQTHAQIQQWAVALTVTGRPMQPPVRPLTARAAPPQANKAKKTPSPRTRLNSKHGKEITRSGVTNKNKSRIGYECRQKGHMGKDCPNGNIPKTNLVHYDFHKLRNDKNGTCYMREISSPQCSMRAIWVRKHLVANPIGPNKCWVPRNAC